MSISKRKKNGAEAVIVDRNQRVDRNVVRLYERLLRETKGDFIIKRGADYHLSPPVGTSKLLTQAMCGGDNDQ